MANRWAIIARQMCWVFQNMGFIFKENGALKQNWRPKLTLKEQEKQWAVISK